MMKKSLLTISITLLLFTACQNSNPQKENAENKNPEEITGTVNINTSEIAQEFKGNYEGILPCADCEGIKTSIELDEYFTYTKKEEYLGKETSLTKEGNFSWDGSKKIVPLEPPFGGSKEMYKVTEGAIILLDSEGKEYTGELANRFVLDKQ